MQSCTERGGMTPDSPVRLHIPRLSPCVELQTFSSDYTVSNCRMIRKLHLDCICKRGEGSTIWCSTTPMCFKRNWGKLVRRSGVLDWIRKGNVLPTSQKRYFPNLLAQYVLLISLYLPNQDKKVIEITVLFMCVCVCVCADRFLLNLVRIWCNWTTSQTCYSKFITICSTTTTDYKIVREDDTSVTYFYVLTWCMATDLCEADIFAEHKIKR
jgi:hypothetical protein